MPFRSSSPVALLGPVVNLSLESRIASSPSGDIQMFSSRDAFENDFCPVKDDLLGEMYRASEHGLPQLVASGSPDVRGMLALFCYRRSHLHSLALAIAASCSEQELVQVGGRVGSTLYGLSREPAARTSPVSLGGRKPWSPSCGSAPDAGGAGCPVFSGRPKADHALHQATLGGSADRG